MNKTIAPLLLLGLCALPGTLLAQSACPTLPSGRNLHWESQQGPDFQVCRALDGQGEQVLGLMFTRKKPNVQLSRNQRREEGWVGSHPVYWYQPPIAEGGAAQKRITVLELEDGRYAQVWVEGRDPSEIQARLQLGAWLGLE